MLTPAHGLPSLTLRRARNLENSADRIFCSTALTLVSEENCTAFSRPDL